MYGNAFRNSKTLIISYLHKKCYSQERFEWLKLRHSISAVKRLYDVSVLLYTSNESSRSLRWTKDSGSLLGGPVEEMRRFQLGWILVTQGSQIATSSADFRPLFVFVATFFLFNTDLRTAQALMSAFGFQTDLTFALAVFDTGAGNV